MALQQLIPQLPEDFPASVVIAQHMPPGFTKSLADRLNKKSKIEVKEAEEGDIVLPKRVLVARAGAHLKFMEKFRQKIVRITLKPHNEPYSPSVNVLYESATIFGRNSLPVIMTGMGTDGTRGLKELKKHNVRTLAQSEKTCAVFGMPKSAINEGLIDRVVDLEGMAKAIIWEI